MADQNGVVDKTHEAISRRTNVPIDIVKEAIGKLEQPDPNSRSQENEGRRIVLLDEHRKWGWMIVNYDHYRKLATEDQRREKTLARVKRYRALQGVTETLPYAYAYASDSSPKGGAGGGEPGWSEQDVIRMADHPTVGMSAGEASAMWANYAAVGWIDATGRPIKDLRAVMLKWKARGPSVGKYGSTDGGPASAGKAPSMYTLQAQLKLIRERRDAMFGRHLTETPEYKRLGAEIKDIEKQLGLTV